MKRHIIFYDAECPICVREMALLHERKGGGHFETVPIQDNETLLEQYGISRADAMTYLHILTADGKMLFGMDALRLMHRLSNGMLLFRISGLPVLKQLSDWIYPYFARNRNRFPAWLLPHPRCENGACSIRKHKE